MKHTQKANDEPRPQVASATRSRISSDRLLSPLALQRTAGNAAVSRLLNGQRGIQRTFAGELANVNVEGLRLKLRALRPGTFGQGQLEKLHTRLNADAREFATAQAALSEWDSVEGASSSSPSPKPSGAPSHGDAAIVPAVTWASMRQVWEHGQGRENAARLCPGYSSDWSLLTKVEAINSQLAVGNRSVIAVSLGLSPTDEVPLGHVKNIAEQFGGMAPGQTEKQTAKAFSDYTKHQYENVTAFTRGKVYDKHQGKDVEAPMEMMKKGGDFFAQLNERWEEAPTVAGFPVVWRVESNPPGEISGEPGVDGRYPGRGALKKINPASTSAVQPIADRADKAGKVVLRITNCKDGDAAHRQPIDLRRLSFYPEEGEILFPPETTYEVIDQQKMKFSGSPKLITVVNVRATPPALQSTKADLAKIIAAKLAAI
jgi:hypothetical protein